MLSIEKCCEVLNQKDKKYNNEEVKVIREYLYQMANVMDELISQDNE